MTKLIAELRGIHQSMAGICTLLEALISAQLEGNRHQIENGRVLREIRDNQPKYGRRSQDLEVAP